MHPFARLDLMRYHLKWAYERSLGTSVAPSPYVSAPIAAWLVRRGSIVVTFHDGERESFGPGDWIFPREGEGMQEYQDDLTILSIRFDAAWSHGEPLFSRQRTLRIPAKDVPDLTRSAEQLVDDMNRYSTRGKHHLVVKGELPGYWEIQRQFLHWLIRWYSALTAHGVMPSHPDALDPKVRKALELLTARPLQLPLREKMLAEEIGLSVSQMNKLFIAQTGATPAAHWQRRKLEAAYTVVINGAESIKTIAYQLGFASPEYFTTWFRKHYGTPPSSLRARYQSSRERNEWV